MSAAARGSAIRLCSKTFPYESPPIPPLVADEAHICALRSCSLPGLKRRFLAAEFALVPRDSHAFELD